MADKNGSNKLTPNKTASKATTCLTVSTDKINTIQKCTMINKFKVKWAKISNITEMLPQKSGNISTFPNWANEQHPHGSGSSPNQAPATVNVATTATASQELERHSLSGAYQPWSLQITHLLARSNHQKLKLGLDVDLERSKYLHILQALSWKRRNYNSKRQTT